MVSILQKLILVLLILSIVYILLNLEIQPTYAGIFKRNILKTPGVSSNNKNLLKNDTVPNLAEMVEGAIKEVPDIKGTGKNANETTGAAMSVGSSRTQVRNKEKEISDEKEKIKNGNPKHQLTSDTEQEVSPKQRAKDVQERCKRFLKNNNQLNNSVRYKYVNGAYVTSRRYNLTICINPKVVSTNTKRILYTLDNNVTRDVNTIKTAKVREYSRRRLTPFQQVLARKNHVSVMLIREPMERLLSAYRDKRGFPSTNTSVNFKDYLQHVLNTKTEKLNRHMYPYYEKCRPCEKQYDFIALHKTFPEDMKAVLKEINALEKVDLPERAKTGYSQGSEEVLQSYYKDVSNDMIHKLWEKYKKDYYIFGFPYPSHLMNKI